MRYSNEPALAAVGLAILIALCGMGSSHAAAPAKKLFGYKKLPAVMKPAAHGFYSKGCLQGAIAIPKNGPTWQAMRLSRNRRWGHPDLIQLVVRLSEDARQVGWNGLLVGDISQPRGGPMLTGHASHQLGLDADIWLTPMPDRKLSYREREDMSATSMLARNKHGQLDQTRISKKKFTKAHFGLIKTAASYQPVERVLVHPTIKRELCRMEKGDRRWLYKVRPYWGHHYHMHVRMGCPVGSPNCRPQKKPANNDGCGSDLAYWFNILKPPKPPQKVKKPAKPPKTLKRAKKKKKPDLRLADLPQACRAVLSADGPGTARAATLQMVNGQAFLPDPKPVRGIAAIEAAISANVTVPTARPAD